MSTVEKPEPLSFTIRDAVTATGMARSRLYQLIAAGELKALKVGRRTLLDAGALKNFLSNLPAPDIRPAKPSK